METTKETKIPKRRGMRGTTKIPLEGLIDHLKKPENADMPSMEVIRWLMEKGLSQNGGFKKIEAAVRDGFITVSKQTDRVNLTRRAFRV